MTYMQGMGLSSVNSYTQTAPSSAPAGAGVNFGVNAGVSGGSGAQSGALALLVILGGLVILYATTRGIQGSVRG